MFEENTIIGQMAKGTYPEKEITTDYGIFKVKYPSADDKIVIENRKADCLGGRPLNQFGSNYLLTLDRDMTLSVVISSYPAKFPKEWKEFNIKGNKIMARVSIDEEGDRELIKKLYRDWKELNDRLKAIGT